MRGYDPDEGLFYGSLRWLVLVLLKNTSLNHDDRRALHRCLHAADSSLSGDPPRDAVVNLLTSGHLYRLFTDVLGLCWPAEDAPEDAELAHATVLDELLRFPSADAELVDSLDPAVLASDDPFDSRGHVTIMSTLIRIMDERELAISGRIVKAIRRFAPYSSATEAPRDSESAIALWFTKVSSCVQVVLAASGNFLELNVPGNGNDFYEAFQNGVALGAVIAFYRPDLLDMNQLQLQGGPTADTTSAAHNLRVVLNAASRASIPCPLKSDDIIAQNDSLRFLALSWAAQLFSKFDELPEASWLPAKKAVTNTVELILSPPVPPEMNTRRSTLTMGKKRRSTAVGQSVSRDRPNSRRSAQFSMSQAALTAQTAAMAAGTDIHKSIGSASRPMSARGRHRSTLPQSIPVATSEPEAASPIKSKLTAKATDEDRAEAEELDWRDREQDATEISALMEIHDPSTDSDQASNVEASHVPTDKRSASPRMVQKSPKSKSRLNSPRTSSSKSRSPKLAVKNQMRNRSRSKSPVPVKVMGKAEEPVIQAPPSPSAKPDKNQRIFIAQAYPANPATNHEDTEVYPLRPQRKHHLSPSGRQATNRGKSKSPSRSNSGSRSRSKSPKPSKSDKKKKPRSLSPIVDRGRKGRGRTPEPGQASSVSASHPGVAEPLPWMATTLRPRTSVPVTATVLPAAGSETLQLSQQLSEKLIEQLRNLPIQSSSDSEHQSREVTAPKPISEDRINIGSPTDSESEHMYNRRPLPQPVPVPLEIAPEVQDAMDSTEIDALKRLSYSAKQAMRKGSSYDDIDVRESYTIEKHPTTEQTEGLPIVVIDSDHMPNLDGKTPFADIDEEDGHSATVGSSADSGMDRNLLIPTDSKTDVEVTEKDDGEQGKVKERWQGIQEALGIKKNKIISLKRSKRIMWKKAVRALTQEALKKADMDKAKSAVARDNLPNRQRRRSAWDDPDEESQHKPNTTNAIPEPQMILHDNKPVAARFDIPISPTETSQGDEEDLFIKRQQQVAARQRKRDEELRRAKMKQKVPLQEAEQNTSPQNKNASPGGGSRRSSPNKRASLGEKRGSHSKNTEDGKRSNRRLIANAVKYTCLAGPVNESNKLAVLKDLESCPATHYVILLHDPNDVKYRALYSYDFETEEAFKICGRGPTRIRASSVIRTFRYDSGSRRFSAARTNNITNLIDAICIATKTKRNPGVV